VEGRDDISSHSRKSFWLSDFNVQDAGIEALDWKNAKRLAGRRISGCTDRSMATSTAAKYDVTLIICDPDPSECVSPQKPQLARYLARTADRESSCVLTQHLQSRPGVLILVESRDYYAQ
jgi:hypothetical protein